MGKFSIGDRAEVLDEAISGIIQKVDGDCVTLMTDDGFPMHYAANDLVRIEGDISVTNFKVAQVKKEKELPKKRKQLRRIKISQFHKQPKVTFFSRKWKNGKTGLQPQFLNNVR